MDAGEQVTARTVTSRAHGKAEPSQQFPRQF